VDDGTTFRPQSIAIEKAHVAREIPDDDTAKPAITDKDVGAGPKYKERNPDATREYDRVC
jgi:hypothetical protein